MDMNKGGRKGGGRGVCRAEGNKREKKNGITVIAKSTKYINDFVMFAVRV